MNIAFFGSHNNFSATAFNFLVQVIPIKLIVLPNAVPFPSPSLPQQLQIQRPHNIEQLARQHDTKIIHHTDITEQQVAACIAAYKIDLIVVACYPKLIPKIQLETSQLGAINMHPSLLPKYRGPSPLFWQLKNNESNMGVTLHCVSGRFDTGDIVAQTNVETPDNANGNDLDNLFARAGSDLLVEVCQNPASLHHFIASAIPQQETLAHYQHPPCSPDDFKLSLNWSARHAYRFMCGTQHLRNPYPIKISGRNLLLTRAVSYSEKPNTNSVMYQDDDVVILNFKVGSLCAHILTKGSTNE